MATAFCLVVAASSALGFTRHRAARKFLQQPLHCATAAPGAAKGPSPSSAVGQPEIFSRKALFGNDYDAASAAGLSIATIADELTMPEGLQRVEPTTLVAKLPTEGAEYEEVDTFRFVIDAAALRKAMEQKGAVQVRQQLSAEGSGSDDSVLSTNELTLDASFLSKLATAKPKEGSPSTLQLEMDFDELHQMIHGDVDSHAIYDEAGDALDGADDDASTARTSGRIGGRPKGLEYSEAQMKEAELFLDGGGSLGTRPPPTPPKAATAGRRISPAAARTPPPKTAVSTPRTRRNAFFSCVYFANALVRAVFRPYNGLHWSDVTPRTVADSLYCTCVVGAAMTATVLASVAVSETVVAWCVRAFAAAINAVPTLRARQLAWQRAPKPLVFIAVVLLRLWWERRQRMSENDTIRGVGYTYTASAADAF